MIIIKILNAREIIEKEKGAVVSRIAPFFVDINSKVEEEIVRQLEAVFAERNIRAVISVVPDESSG